MECDEYDAQTKRSPSKHSRASSLLSASLKKKGVTLFSRPTFQAGPEDGPQKAASVQRLSDHGEGRELAEEEPHPRALQWNGLLRRRRERLHRQWLPLLGGPAGSVHVVRDAHAPAFFPLFFRRIHLQEHLRLGSLNLG